MVLCVGAQGVARRAIVVNKSCMLYQFLRPMLFKADAETAHNLSITALKFAPIPTLGSKSDVLAQNFAGLRFANPVGLAPGYDKNAEVPVEILRLGFGFTEVGTLTPLPQEGNPKPRLFRLVEDKAVINRMGFNNEGLAAMKSRLEKRRSKVIVGGNLGKNKVTPNELADDDYCQGFEALYDVVDYFVVNVSSPNTPNLRALQDRDSLTEIIQTLKRINNIKPLLVKIAPDLTDDAVRDIAALAETEHLAGIIATNTTLDHSSVPKDSDQQGGLSGGPLRQRSTEVLRILRSATKLPIIASGGIMDAASAHEKLDAGANLVQIYTGFVYNGPDLIRKIAD